jgi:hypothetical protein
MDIAERVSSGRKVVGIVGWRNVMATVGQVAVIIAQEGTDGALAVEARRLDTPAVVLLSQEPGETLGSLGQRVRARVKALVTEGFRIRSATFVARNGFDLPDVPATMELLRVLVSSMVAVGAGRVYLSSQSKGMRSHYALESLASAIGDQVRGTGVEIVNTPRGQRAPATVIEASL